MPDDKSLAGLSQIVVSAVDNVTYTDNSTDEATSTSAVHLRTRLSFDQNPMNTAENGVINPAVTVNLLNGDGAIDGNASDTVTLSVTLLTSSVVKTTGPLFALDAQIGG